LSVFLGLIRLASRLGNLRAKIIGRENIFV